MERQKHQSARRIRHFLTLLYLHYENFENNFKG
jgi:hypothetical protein